MNSEQKWIEFCKEQGINRGQLAGNFECKRLGVLDAKEKSRETAPRKRKNRTQWWNEASAKERMFKPNASDKVEAK